MATSGTTTYSINRDELIKEALAIIEVLEEGEDPTSDQLTDSVPALEMLVKALSTRGIALWKRQEQEITPLVESQASYTIAPSGGDITDDKPLRVLEASLYNSDDDTETPLTIISLHEYDNLSDKTVEGHPTQLFIQPNVSSTDVYIWPVPNSTVASDYTIKLWVEAYIEDMTSSNTDFDIPVEWMEYVTYALAVRLAPRFGYPIEKRRLLRVEAKDAYEMVDSWDQEYASVFIRPSKN